MGEAKEKESSPVEELVTFSRINGGSKTSTYTFQHRRSYTITNYDNPIVVARTLLNVDAGGNPERTSCFKWVRYSAKCLPIRALSWWIDGGEMAFLNNFSAIKFKHAKIHVHNMSFRTQFITGSSAVGYANSNMIMHGLICDGDHNLPPHQIYDDSRIPSSGATNPNALTGSEILQREWASGVYPWTVTDGPADQDATGPSIQFKNLSYQPWFLHAITDPTGLPILYRKSNWIQWQGINEIVGKKVKEWKREYDLQSHWSDRWIPLVPHQVTDNYNGLANPQLETGGFRINPEPLAGVNGVTNNFLLNCAICPTRPNELLEPVIDATQDRGVPINIAKTAGVSFQPNQHLRPIGTLFLSVEHLPNADKTIVPIIWDFYIDTEITIECSMDQFPYIMEYATIPNTTTGVPQNVVDKSFAHWNRRAGTVYHDLDPFGTVHNTTAYEGGPPKWGQIQGISGFGSMGTLGSMVPSQVLEGILGDLSIGRDAEEDETSNNRKRFEQMDTTGRARNPIGRRD
jgi:hypothetical protein